MATSARATDKTWTGATSTTWGTGSNWPGSNPTSGDNAVFNSTFTNQPNLAATATVGGIWMTGSVGQNVTISGSTLTIQGNTINGTANLGILVDNANAFTLAINAPLKLGAAQTWRNNSGNLLTIGGAVDTNNKPLTVDGSGNTTISGAVSGSNVNSTISKAGSGTLILSGSNTHVGATTVSAGVLNIQNASALGTTTGGTTVSSGAALQVQGGIAVVAEALTLNGAGIASDGALRNISGNNSFAGAITLTSASTIASDSGTLTLSGGITNGGFTVTFGGSGNVTENGLISGTGGLIKNGSGTLTLAASNTFSGGSTLNGGTTVVYGGSLGASTGAATINSATLDVAATVTSTRNITLGSATSTIMVDPSLTFTANGVFGGGGTLNKTGSGTLILGGANTYIGGTNVSAGTLQIGASERLADAGALTVSGGTFDLQSFNETVNGVILTSGSIVGSGTLTGSSYALQSGTVSAILAGSGAILTKTTSGTVTLSGANTYTGGTAINGGTLYITSSGALGSSGTISFGGGTLEYSASNTTDYSSRFSTAINQAYSIDTNGQNVTLASALTSSGGTLTKVGSGTLTLSGANSYTGSTTISGGTLQVNANNALGTVAGSTTVLTGAVLKLNNVNYSTAEGLTLNGSGISNGGALCNSGTSTFAGAINIATDATISASGGTLNLTGGISKNGTTLTFSGGGTVNIMSNGITGSSPNSDLVVDGTTVVLDTANSYNGPTTVQNSGTLKLGANNVLPSSPQTALTVNTSSAFDMASYSDGVASLAGDSTGTVKNSVASTTSTLTVNPGSGVSTTFAGVIAGTNGGAQGNIALVKTGAGTMMLAGANTYSGSTTINGGTLTAAATSGSALGSTSSVTVNSGGTLALGAADQINNSAPITLAGGTFAKGNFSEGTAGSVGLGALTLTASGSRIDFGSGTVGILCFASFSPGANTLVIDNWTGTANTVGSTSTDRLIFDSNQSANLSNFWFAGYAPGASEFSLGNGYYEITPTVVPEPSTYAGAALALGVLALHFLRSRKTPTRGGTTAVSSH